MKLTKLASVAAICFSAAASADVTWTYLGTGLSQNAGLNYGASRAFDARAVSSFSNINVGQHLFEVWGTTRTTFCVQLFEGVTVGGGYNFAQVDVSAVPDAPPAPGPMGVIKASLMQDLYRRFYSDVDTSLEASAFQLAIYEISHENLTASTAEGALAQLNLSLGAFQTSASSAAFASAAAMLASLGNGGFGSVGANLRGLTNPTAQDQLLLVPIGAPAILAGLGLLGVGIMRRRLR